MSLTFTMDFTGTPTDWQAIVARTPFGALLLEDEPLISMDVEATLGLAGFEVASFSTCREALAFLHLSTPDVVIIDIELRDGPSTEVAELLLRREIPFVVHTGTSPSTHASGPFARGTWVSKPSGPEDLVSAVRAATVANDAQQ